MANYTSDKEAMKQISGESGQINIKKSPLRILRISLQPAMSKIAFFNCLFSISNCFSSVNLTLSLSLILFLSDNLPGWLRLSDLQAISILRKSSRGERKCRRKGGRNDGSQEV